MKVTGNEFDRMSSAGGAGARGADARPGRGINEGFEASLVEILDATEEPTPHDSRLHENTEGNRAEVDTGNDDAQQVEEFRGSETAALQQEPSREEGASASSARGVQELAASGAAPAPPATPPPRTTPPPLDIPPPVRNGEAPPANASSAAPPEGAQTAIPLREPPANPEVVPPRAEPRADTARSADDSQRAEVEGDPRTANSKQAAAHQANQASSDRPIVRTGTERPQVDTRTNSERAQLVEAPGSESLREAAQERRSDAQTGDDRPRDEGHTRSAVADDSARSTTARPDAFQVASAPETASVQNAPQAAAAIVAPGDAAAPLAQAALPQPALEAAAALEEPVAPGSTPRPLPAEAIPQHIEWLAARGGGSAQIQLYPPELGKLAIQVTVRGDDVQVVMNVREAAAQTVVAEYRDSLENALASKDLKLDQFEVRDWRERGDAQGNEQQRQHADEPSREGDGREGDAGQARGIAGALSAPPHISSNQGQSQAQNVNLHV